MKKIKLCNILIVIYIIATILCTVFSVPLHNTPFYQYSLALGASSFWISLAQCGIEEIPVFISVFLFSWIFTLPVLLIISCIMARKGKYAPICITVSIDSAIVAFWFCRCYMINDSVAFSQATTDTIVSILFLFVLMVSTKFVTKTRDSTGDGSVVPTDES